jgi:hypothetical protein
VPCVHSTYPCCRSKSRTHLRRRPGAPRVEAPPSLRLAQCRLRRALCAAACQAALVSAAAAPGAALAVVLAPVAVLAAVFAAVLAEPATVDPAAAGPAAADHALPPAAAMVHMQVATGVPCRLHHGTYPNLCSSHFPSGPTFRFFSLSRSLGSPAGRKNLHTRG